MTQKQQRRSTQRREAPKRKRGSPAPPPVSHNERRIDESLDASFPASDPPAHSSVSHPDDEDAIERGED
jgi:hypothetical protein